MKSNSNSPSSTNVADEDEKNEGSQIKLYHIACLVLISYIIQDIFTRQQFLNYSVGQIVEQ